MWPFVKSGSSASYAPRARPACSSIRHGESAPARPDAPFALVDGQGDPELAPNGRQQAQRVAERLAAEPISAIYVTTLRRTAETAAPLAARLGIVPVVEPGLREVHLGEWEGGLFRIRVAEGHPVAQQLVAEERWDVIPGAEPARAFAGRVRDARWCESLHGIRIKPWRYSLTEASSARPWPSRLAADPSPLRGADNGSISHLVITSSRWVVRTFNDVAHLHPGFAPAAEALT